MSGTIATDDFAPLDIKCTNTKCGENLHCFLSKKRRKGAGLSVADNQCCRECGVKLVDWERVHRRSMADVEFTLEMLRYEYIRHYFWHVEIDDKAVDHARRKGRVGLREAAEQRIRKSVAAAEPTYDGRQTPKKGNVLFYAQHATATCCRKCMQEWHNIPIGEALSEEQIDYLSKLLLRYVEDRLPNLTEHGEIIPLLRRKAVSANDQPALWDQSNYKLVPSGTPKRPPSDRVTAESQGQPSNAHEASQLVLLDEDGI